MQIFVVYKENLYYNVICIFMNYSMMIKEGFLLDYDFYEDKTYVDRRNARRAAERARQRKKKLFARRATIVGIMLLILILIIAGIVALFNGCSKKNEQANSTQQTTTNQAQSQSNTTNNADKLTFSNPQISYDKEIEGYYSPGNSAVYIYDNAAYELFSGTEESAQDYADCISEFKASLGENVKVYNMVIPNHIEFGIPRQYLSDAGIQSNSQSENIKSIYSSYSEDVIAINCYNELSSHCDEYIYFDTDHHWTGLGAYYAYKAFCEQTNQSVLDLSKCTENTIDGYEGSLLYCDGSLYNYLDTVHYWTFPYNTYAMRTESSGDIPYETTIYYEGATAGPYTYGAFIWGDCSLFVEHNEDIQNDKKIAVVKESYGNAFVPYLTANYEEVHVIDFRYFDGSLKSYCEENGIEEVLFVNNIMAANTAIQVDRIRTLLD